MNAGISYLVCTEAQEAVSPGQDSLTLMVI